jgi:hypothetical protein
VWNPHLSLEQKGKNNQSKTEIDEKIKKILEKNQSSKGKKIRVVHFYLGFVLQSTFLWYHFCHTRVLGAPRPGREHNHQVWWDQVSHIRWIMAQDRMSHLNYIIRVLYKINNYIIRRQRSSNPKLIGRRRPRPLTNKSWHPSSASSCGTYSWPTGWCKTARVSSHTFIAQQVVGNNVHELAKGGSSREV